MKTSGNAVVTNKYWRPYSSQIRIYTKYETLPVILCHGLGGSMDFHLWPLLATSLNEHGIGILRFDFNGCGKSEGQFENMTVSNEIDDLLDVIAYARKMPITADISLLGHSQGGVVAGMAAGRCGAIQIKSLVLISAAAVLRDDALRGSTQGAVYDPWHLDKPCYEIPGRSLNIGRTYIQDAMNLPIYETTARYKGPAFIVTGMADRVVPYTYAERYRHVLDNSELTIIPGADHTWSGDPDYVTTLVSHWLIQKAKGESLSR